MKTWVLLASLFASAAWAQDTAEVFNDKGSTFVRAGSKAGLKVGSELSLSADAKGTKPAGRATVLEVWESMARLSLDDAAKKGKAHYVLLDGAPAVVDAGVAAVVDAGVAKPAAPPPAPAPHAAALKGRIEKGLARLSVFNDSNQKWTSCQVRISDGRFYDFQELLPQSDEGILLIKFKRDAEPPLDWVNVKCDEGESRFVFANPSAPGKLKGYAQLGNAGRIIIFNSGELPWNRCVATLPSNSLYVLGTLKAQSDEGIMQSKFKRQDPAADRATVKCDQGEFTAPLPK